GHLDRHGRRSLGPLGGSIAHWHCIHLVHIGSLSAFIRGSLPRLALIRMGSRAHLVRPPHISHHLLPDSRRLTASSSHRSCACSPCGLRPGSRRLVRVTAKSGADSFKHSSGQLKPADVSHTALESNPCPPGQVFSVPTVLKAFRVQARTPPSSSHPCPNRHL